MWRECSTCHKKKPITEFGVASYIRKDGTPTMKGTCLECNRAIQAAYRSERRDIELRAGRMKTGERYLKPNIITILNPDRTLYQQFKTDRLTYVRFRRRVKNTPSINQRFRAWMSTTSECETAFVLRLSGLSADYRELLKDEPNMSELGEHSLKARKTLADGWGRPTDLGLTDKSFSAFVASKPIEDPFRGYSDYVLERISGRLLKRVYSCAGANRWNEARAKPERTDVENWVSSQELRVKYGNEAASFIQKDVKVRIARVHGRMRVWRGDIADSLKRFEEWKNPPPPEAAYKPDCGKPTPRGFYHQTTLRAFLEAWSR